MLELEAKREEGREGKGAKMRQVAHFRRARSHKGNDGMSGRLGICIHQNLGWEIGLRECAFLHEVTLHKS